MQKYETIEKGIANKDTYLLKEAMGGLCYTCRDFSDGEFDEVLKYIEGKGVKIKEKFNGDPPLISKNKRPEEFINEDFTNAVFEMKKNFCDERISDVKKIGKALYGRKTKSNAAGGLVSGKGEDPKAESGHYQNKVDLVMVAIAVVLVIVVVVGIRALVF